MTTKIVQNWEMSLASLMSVVMVVYHIVGAW